MRYIILLCFGLALAWAVGSTTASVVSKSLLASANLIAQSHR